MSNLTGVLISLYRANHIPTIAGVLVLIGILSLFRSKPIKAPDNKNRTPGNWEADKTFVTPTPPAFKNWDPVLTKPLPYRAFKHNYHVTMGIRNMDWSSWFELDNQWQKFHDEKLKRLEERDTEVYGTSPKAVDAAWELLQEMARYLPARYPTMFRSTPNGLENLITHETFNTTKTSSPKEDPIKMAAKLVQDDLAIMVEGEDGQYSLESGAIILAGFWRFRDKFQMTLDQIHTSGDVPQYNEKLKNGMNRFFTRITVDKPVVRNNYFIQTDDNLGWSSSIGGEDNEVVGWYTAEKAVGVDQLYFRSERQSLRRLPKSGAVVFTIRTYFVPMVELCSEPYIPRRLLNGINSWTGDVEEYKGYEKYKDVLLPYLEETAKKQEEAGYAEEGGPSAYPW